MDFITLFFLIAIIVVVVKVVNYVNRQNGGGRISSVPTSDGAAAAQLARDLRAGWSPPPVQVPFPLQPNETCVAVVDADAEQWLEGDRTYTHKSVGWAGGLTGLAIGSAMSAAGNAARRSKAAREAAEKWRYIDSYRVYVTTSRIALQGSREWRDIWYVNLRTLEYDHQGITFQTSGDPRSRLRMFPADYWFVMLRKLAYNEIYDIPTPC